MKNSDNTLSYFITKGGDNMKYFLINTSTLILLLISILTISNGCANKEEVKLPQGEWVLIEKAKLQIYVKFTGSSGESASLELFFISAGKIPDETEKDWQRRTPMYAFGRGSVEGIVILGRRTTHFDVYGRPSGTEGEEYIRLEILDFDASENVATIRVLPFSKKES